jgi:hypothetical protein
VSVTQKPANEHGPPRGYQGGRPPVASTRPCERPARRAGENHGEDLNNANFWIDTVGLVALRSYNSPRNPRGQPGRQTRVRKKSSICLIASMKCSKSTGLLMNALACNE